MANETSILSVQPQSAQVSAASCSRSVKGDVSGTDFQAIMQQKLQDSGQDAQQPQEPMAQSAGVSQAIGQIADVPATVSETGKPAVVQTDSSKETASVSPDLSGLAAVVLDGAPSTDTICAAETETPAFSQSAALPVSCVVSADAPVYAGIQQTSAGTAQAAVIVESGAGIAQLPASDMNGIAGETPQLDSSAISSVPADAHTRAMIQPPNAQTVSQQGNATFQQAVHSSDENVGLTPQTAETFLQNANVSPGAQLPSDSARIGQTAETTVAAMGTEVTTAAGSAAEAGRKSDSGSVNAAQTKQNGGFYFTQDFIRTAAKTASGDLDGFSSDHKSSSESESGGQAAVSLTGAKTGADTAGVTAPAVFSVPAAVSAGVHETGSTGSQQAASSSLPAQVAQQIEQNYASGSREFEMRLSPENLGGITVKMSVKASSLVVEIVASSKEAQSILSSGSSDLRMLLQNRLDSSVHVQVVSDEKQYDAQDSGNGGGHQQRQQENQREQQDDHPSYTGDFLSLMQLIGQSAAI